MTSEDKAKLRKEIVRTYQLNPKATSRQVIEWVEGFVEDQVLREIEDMLLEQVLQKVTRVTQPLFGHWGQFTLGWDLSVVRKNGGTDECLKQLWEFCRTVNSRRLPGKAGLNVLVHKIWQSTGNVMDRTTGTLCDGITIQIQYENERHVLEFQELLSSSLEFFRSVSFSSLTVVKR